MTNEEAIKIFKTELEVRSNGYYDYLVNGGKDDCEEEASLSALQLAIKALEKQIPKKPIARKHDELRGHILFHCPTCDDDFNCNEYEETYCAECGQAILWEGEE